MSFEAGAYFVWCLPRGKEKNTSTKTPTHAFFSLCFHHVKQDRTVPSILVPKSDAVPSPILCRPLYGQGRPVAHMSRNLSTFFPHALVMGLHQYTCDVSDMTGYDARS